jgi:hypothetical protein
MRAWVSCLALLAFAAGCAKPPAEGDAPPKPTAPSETRAKSTFEPSDPNAARLPTAPGAKQVDKGEGQLPIAGANAGDKSEVAFVARVTATEKGQIDKIILSGDGLSRDGLDLKTDVAAFAKKLTELAAASQGKRIELKLEIDDKLLQAHVVQLVDVSIRAGIADVSPVPIDPKRR